MINKLKELFLKLEKKKGSINSDTEIEDKDISLTCAALLIELVFADKIMNAEEIDSLRSSLEKTYELDEATVTGDIGAYSTPYAFSGKKKKKKYATTSTGYKLPK